MRVRAFPFGPAVSRFLQNHERVFVVEQNRDAQLRSLLALETGMPRDSMIPILDYGGVPLSAEPIVERVKVDQRSRTADFGLRSGTSIRDSQSAIRPAQGTPAQSTPL
jgi:2-oxoglutarate ferredoxin oxidoreductase subunit alpha